MRMLLVISLLFGLHAFAQDENQNLVPNPSFEAKNHCPVIIANFNSAVQTWNGYGSVEYYHECGLNGAGVPDNWYGNIHPHGDGEAYAAISLWAEQFANFREYISVKLTKSLVAGSEYKVTMYVSLADSVAYATNSLGVYVTRDSISNEEYLSDIFLSKTPSFEYDGSLLDNKENWTLVEGTFTAEGGEQYLVIGNFADDVKTDIHFVGGVSENFDYSNYTYYYIDDISLTLESATGLTEQQTKKDINVYPNPSNGSMFVEYSGLEENSTLELYNSAGQIVDSYQLVFNGTGILSINRTDLSAGIYTYRIVEKGMETITNRIVIR